MMIDTTQQDIILVQISDTHLMEHVDKCFIGILPDLHFHQILKHIKQQVPHITAIIHTGDIAQESSPEVYQYYLNTMQALNVPFFQTLGNHDCADYFPNNMLDSPTIYPTVLQMGGWQVILLNTAVKGRIDGYISEIQLSELRKNLSKNTQPTIIAFHHHAFKLDSKWIDQHQLKNTDQLLDVLKDYSHVKACFMGHVHQPSDHQWQHIHFYTTPATSIQFKPHSETFSLDNTPPAFRKIILKADGSVETALYYLTEFQLVELDHTGY